MATRASDVPGITGARDRDELLAEIQDRVLWLAMQMVYYANRERPNPDGTKVGGHQTSSASVVTILTSLFFDYMKPGDRISVKPHASPILHAIQYLMGNLSADHLKTFRQFHGLQAYPSRTKDPDPVDFSTGSVGLGSIAPNFAAVAEEYIRYHFPGHESRPYRYISLVGDAELDEGTVWEAVVEPLLGEYSNTLWVVDLNRQSLDRVIPGIRVQVWRDMFRANGWHVINAKYGTRLEAAFALPKGELLRRCIDDMSNEAYQRILRSPGATMREWIPRYSRHPADLRKFIDQWDDQELWELFTNLGGHDFTTLRRAFAEADQVEQPCVVFAYTQKGWRLPVVGDPQNHSVILSREDMEQLRQQLGIPQDEVWAGFDPEHPTGRFCLQRGQELRSQSPSESLPPDLDLPTSLARPHRGMMSTQQAFGTILTDIARDLPELARRIVTASPDVASSTNLGGWINKVGVWTPREKEPLPEDIAARTIRWEETPHGQHIELGISENNLFMLLGQLGLTFEMSGELLLPIGTVYDPFVVRGAEAFLYSLYAGSCFMVVGTPSGITLSPEGGAHQSVITPSIGIGLPGVTFYEPAFAQELEWIILWALDRMRRREGAFYIRLTTRPVNQDALAIPDDPVARERMRQRVLDGAYRLVDLRGEPDYCPGENVVNIFATGAIMPEALEASQRLREEGVFANVINVTSADRLFRRYRGMVVAAMKGEATSPFLADVVPASERGVPIVTVQDGHPHALAWLGSALGTRAHLLGVSDFGQSGSRSDLYREYGIDPDSIMAACFAALEG